MTETPSPEIENKALKTEGTGQIDKPELQARADNKVIQEAEQAAENLSIAQRLTRRAKQETIIIPFQDDIGTFDIEVRLPTAAEMDYINEIQERIAKAGKENNRAAADEASLLLYQKMEEITIDPSLTVEFFKSGNFISSDFGQIIKEILLEEQRRVSSIASFRKVRARS